MPDDELTAVLAGIRRRAEQLTHDHDEDDCGLDGETCTGHDAERLADVVDEVLRPHQPGPIVVVGALCPKHENHRYFSITGTEAAAVEACPGCPATVYRSCAGCATPISLDRCPVRAIAARELLGKEGE